MRLAYLTVAALAAVLVAVPVHANPCNTCAQTYAAPTYQYVTPIYQTYLTLPLYGAAYVGGYGGTGDETNRLLAELLNEQKALRQEITAMRSGAPIARDPTPILKAQCASCHTEGTSRSEFTMFDEKGNLFKLSPPDRKAMVRMLETGQMPPPVRNGAGPPTQKMIQSERADLAAMLKQPIPSTPGPAVLPPAPPTLPPPPLTPPPPEEKKPPDKK